jgi:type IV pilus assembly protein PilW
MTLISQRGFSLAGTMTGMLVGLMVAASALGTASFMEAQKRTSMGGNSALANGSFGIFRIESASKLAGLGLMAQRSFACNSMNLSYQGAVLLDGAPLYPLLIVDGGALSDTVTVAYTDSLTSAAPAHLLTPMANAADSIKVSNAPDAQIGRLLLVQSSAVPCTMFGITAVASSGFGQDIAHVGGDYNGGAYATAVAYPENSRAAVSSGLTWTTFRVNRNTLEEVNNITGAVMVVATDIIALKAHYGVTDGVSTTISNWVSATGAYALPTLPDMQKVRAIRIGLLARSQDKNTSCLANDAAPTLWPAGPAVNLTATADWKCFKYRSLNMVIPLVNVALGMR